MRRNTLAFLLFSSLLSPLIAFSQVLTGRVTSEGNAVPGATVLVKALNRGTSTDADGRYTLRLDPGTHLVTFSYVGYTTRTETVTLRENEDRVLNVELRVSAVEQEVVVIVGTRATGRTVTDSPLPIDVLTAQELNFTGQNSFDKTLQVKVPSFQVSQTPVNDATALLDPWEIRNMGVSRTLILVNGKRKNLSALAYTQTSPSRGETASDISAIPMDAIKRVEILRDGASAQYGSDAIAGVINIVLKDNTDGGYVALNTGITNGGKDDEGFSSGMDGGRVGIALNYGSPIFDEKGFVNYTIDLSRIDEARRSGIVDANGEASDFGATLADVQNFLNYDKFAGNRSSSPATSSGKFLLNSGVSLSENTDLYANAAYVYKKVNSFANYRTPYWRPASAFPYLANFFPDGPNGSYVGYLPTFDGDLLDYNTTFGFRTKKGEWNFDASFTLGYNSQDYTVFNSHNRSDIRDSSAIILYTPNDTKEANETYLYRENSPISFRPGGSIFSHQVWNLDISRAVTDQLSVAVGSEFRSETFEITPGDKASWDGIGADSFAGNRPENTGIFTRYNFGGYFDVSYDITKEFLVSATFRNEYYSDFGNAFVYKISSRFKTLDDLVTLRGSYSTGFKAPTLHQIYTQRVQYSFVPGAGVQSIGLVNNVSPQARQLGVKPLEPEESKNVTIGVGARLMPDFNVTLDYYDISISDRIVISNRVPFGTGEVEFFTNSIRTKTSGVDIVIDYKNLEFLSGSLGFSFAGNLRLKNERDGGILQVGGQNVIDATQEALFFTSRPKEKFVVGLNYEMERFGVSLNNTYFGSTEFSQNAGPGPLSVVYGLKTVFEPKIVTDLGVTFELLPNLTASAHINNVLDVIPEWKFEAVNDVGQKILTGDAAAIATTKQVSNLLTFNGRYPMTTYDGYHFSQLGRIYNLTLKYGL